MKCDRETESAILICSRVRRVRDGPFQYFVRSRTEFAISTDKAIKLPFRYVARFKLGKVIAKMNMRRFKNTMMPFCYHGIIKM